jgi:hypothetical protein
MHCAPRAMSGAVFCCRGRMRYSGHWGCYVTISDCYSENTSILRIRICKAVYLQIMCVLGVMVFYCSRTSFANGKHKLKTSEMFLTNMLYSSSAMGEVADRFTKQTGASVDKEVLILDVSETSEESYSSDDEESFSSDTVYVSGVADSSHLWCHPSEPFKEGAIASSTTFDHYIGSWSDQGSDQHLDGTLSNRLVNCSVRQHHPQHYVSTWRWDFHPLPTIAEEPPRDDLNSQNNKTLPRTSFDSRSTKIGTISGLTITESSSSVLQAESEECSSVTYITIPKRKPSSRKRI